MALATCLLGAASAQAQPFVYVANQGSANVSQYNAIGGPLSALTPASVTAGGGSVGVAVSPDGKSVYVANSGFEDTVSQYDVGADGTLTPKTPAAVAASSAPIAVAASPDGKSVYVTNNYRQLGVAVRRRAGRRAHTQDPIHGAGRHRPDRVAVSPDGKSVYVANSDSLRGHRVAVRRRRGRRAHTQDAPPS